MLSFVDFNGIRITREMLNFKNDYHLQKRIENLPNITVS